VAKTVLLVLQALAQISIRPIAPSSHSFSTPVNSPTQAKTGLEWATVPNGFQCGVQVTLVPAPSAVTGSKISRMRPIPWRTQLGAVAAGYAMVVLVAAALLLARHIQYVTHRADANTYGGMYAFGDLMLGLFIGGLFLIPTLFLVLVIRKSEPAYTRYSQILLGLSLTAPISLGTLLIPAVSQGNSFLGWFCMGRLFASPIVIAGLAVSRLLARFDRAKRLTLYALLVELGTIALMVALFLFLAGTHRE
jgi:hypothetical protein